jgi:hypothetical protein
MKRREKWLLWYRGAKFALKALKKSGESMEGEAQELLAMPGMSQMLRDDYWVRGFVAMLKKKAKWKDPFFLPGHNQGM